MVAMPQQETSAFTDAMLELQSHPQWIVRDAAKVPFNPLTGAPASAGVPSTWATYMDARAALMRNRDKYAGVGYEFLKTRGITGVDLDHCIDEHGNIDAWAQTIIDSLASYPEYSQSGDGVHIFTRASLPETCRHKFALKGERHEKAAIEIYDDKRYFAMTFKHVPGTPETIEPRQGEIDALYKRYAPPEQEQASHQERASYQPGASPSDLSDTELLRRASNARNGAKFDALWRGDISAYGGDDSRADLALCGLLAFWTGKDAGRIDHLFRQSGLMRDKWDRPTSGSTYGAITIERACAQCSQTYDPRSPREKVSEEIERLLERLRAQAQNRRAGKRKRAPYRITAQPVDLEKVLMCLDSGEYGDAQLFTLAFQGQVVYDHTEGKWYLWDGHYWKQDRTGRVKHLVSGDLGKIYLQAAAELHPQFAEAQTRVDTLKARPIQATDTAAQQELETARNEANRLKGIINALRGRAQALCAAKRNQAVRGFIDSYLPINSEEWDTHPYLLACPNGVIDLKTGVLRDGEPEDYIRTACPTEWAGLDTPSPRFEQFLEEIFADKPDNIRRPLIDFLHRLIGYGATGSTKEAIFPVFYGEQGRNGKDTLFSTLKDVLGPLVGAVSNDVFISQDRLRAAGAATPHLCDLQGKRLVWGSETKQGDKLNISQIKLITGGGDISARQNYGNQYVFTPTHKIALMTNYKPHADANDAAFWSRACLIEFGLRFVNTPQASNERKADHTLKEALQQEASGILAWIVRGCLEWQKQGLAIPECIAAMTTQYREEEDTIAQFINECCFVGEYARIEANRLYSIYSEWCKANQMSAMNGRLFGEKITKRFKKVRNKRGMEYQGIGDLENNPPSGEPRGTNESGREASSDQGVGSESTLHQSYTSHKAAWEASSQGDTTNDGVGCNDNPTPSPETASEASSGGSQGDDGVGGVGSCNKSAPYGDKTARSGGVYTTHPTHPTPDDEGCVDKPAWEAGSGDGVGSESTLHHPTPPVTDLRPEWDRLVAQVRAYAQDRETLFWNGPGTDYPNGAVSITEYVNRLKACKNTGDPRRIRAAMDAMKNTLGLNARRAQDAD